MTKIVQFIKSTKFQVLIIFITCTVMFGYWQWCPTLADPDSFYHIKMSQLITKQGIVQNFPWMQHTVLHDYFVDHHLLYHILLIPFTNIGYDLIGIKISVVVFAASFFVILFLIFKALKFNGALFFTLLTACTAPFTFRLNLVKANSLSLIILFIILFLAYRYKYKWLIFFSWLFVWAYGGFILSTVIVILLAVVDAIYNKKLKRNIYLILSNISGLALGLLISPYFPKNLLFYWQQVVQIGLINYRDKIGVGGEWYPYNLTDLITGCSLLTVIAIFCLIIFLVFIKKQNVLSWFGLGLFIIGLLAVLKSKRYIEYYVPFTAFFDISVISAIFSEYFKKINFNYLFNLWIKNWLNKLIMFVVVLYCCLVIPTVVISDYQINSRDLRGVLGGIKFSKFQKASEWLKNNSEPGSIVFHSDWDEFPNLFYHNSNNYYIVGLDPTFMYNYNQDLYWQFVNITTGKQKENLPDILTNDFHAQYVLLEKDHETLDININKFKRLKLVYEDNEAKIYEVKKEPQQ